ncbi:MAG TPA: class I SAM-dependent methyltransferase [Actinotalea sp.]|jgi:SAM-dependent methyltransferase
MTTSERHDHPETPLPPSPETIGWEAWYASQGQIWSGRPNGALVAEVGAERPGTALDVGCGEGGDAVWLASRGWDVTAVDVAAAALERGRDAARAAGVTVRWLMADLTEGPELGTFDLVSLQYPALRHTPGDDAIRSLLGAVAPGGTLLATWHATMTAEHARERGFELEDYVQHDDLLTHLDDAWAVEVDETRPRPHPPEGSHHADDIVLRARRRA